MTFENPKLLIDGALVDAEGGATFASINPATEEVVGQAPDATVADTERATTRDAPAPTPYWPGKSPGRRKLPNPSMRTEARAGARCNRTMSAMARRLITGRLRYRGSKQLIYIA